MVDKVLEDETITTKIDGTHMYLNRCKRKTPTIDSLLGRDDLQRIDPVQHGRPNPSKLDGVEFLPPEENDADIYSGWKSRRDGSKESKSKLK